MPLPSRAVFTICSNNYVAMAKVLLSSSQRHHADARHYLCLADELNPDAGFYPGDGVDVVLARDLGIPGFEALAFRYDVMEFNTALKPFMFRHLLARGHSSVVYFDPDIEVFAPLDDVYRLLDAGASFVLTPHLTAPAERDAFPDDIGIMRAGVYNLGFLAVGACDEADSVLRWWSRRLTYQCVNEPASGIFVDQKFMDLVPGFAEGARVLRDTAYNVAYWNLHQRALGRDAAGWTVDGRPLRFFHFSGISPSEPSRLSKHTVAFRRAERSGDLQALMADYIAQLQANGHGRVPDGDYAYGRFASGTHVPAPVRQMFRERHLLWHADPFKTYEEFLHLPHAQGFGRPDVSITNLMHYLHGREPWLQATFPATGPERAEAFRAWYVKAGHTLLKDRRLIEPVALQAARVSPGAVLRCPPARSGPDEPEVSVVGYLRLALGVGEAGRKVLTALHQCGADARGVATELNSPSPRSEDTLDHLIEEQATARIQVFAVNADQLPHVLDDLGPRVRADAYRIAVPFWELEEFPAPWLAAFDRVDEVWAPTRFIQSALACRLAKPVLHMPLPLALERPPAPSRAKFGLPVGVFIFFFAFDFFSYVERKNPMAVVRAYRRAFSVQERANVKVVVKALNAEAAPAHGQAMRELLRNDPDITLVAQTLSREDTVELIAACDAVVSLHRSEGLGLLIAEAMALGKPVVATDYSATTELLTRETGWPVDFSMVPVEANQYVHGAGQVWAKPDEHHAANQMRRVVFDRAEAQRRSEAAHAFLEKEHSAAACGERMLRRLHRIGHGPA